MAGLDAPFPYATLIEANRRRGRQEAEFWEHFLYIAHAVTQAHAPTAGGPYRHDSANVTSSIHANGFSRDEIGFDQHPHRLRNLDCAAPSTNRSCLRHLIAFLVGHVGRGQNRARGDGIDQNLIGAQFKRERLG